MLARRCAGGKYEPGAPSHGQFECSVIQRVNAAVRTFLSLAVLFLTAGNVVVEETVADTFPARTVLINTNDKAAVSATYLSPGRLFGAALRVFELWGS